MKPVSPVVPGHYLPEVVYAKNQRPYLPLPVHKALDGVVLSRWKLTLKERLSVLVRGDVYLWVSTMNDPLQPVMLQVEKPLMGEREALEDQ
jgi:hypothetical protein